MKKKKKKTNLQTTNLRRKGGRLAKFWSEIWCEMTMEETLMRMMHSIVKVLLVTLESVTANWHSVCDAILIIAFI